MGIAVAAFSYRELNFLYRCFTWALYGQNRQDVSLSCEEEAELPKVNFTLAKLLISTKYSFYILEKNSANRGPLLQKGQFPS